MLLDVLGLTVEESLAYRELVACRPPPPPSSLHA